MQVELNETPTLKKSVEIQVQVVADIIHVRLVGRTNGNDSAADKAIHAFVEETGVMLDYRYPLDSPHRIIGEQTRAGAATYSALRRSL